MTAFIDFTNSEQKTEFTDSSREDTMYAKSFWESIQLHPPIESRLVSSNIKQRLQAMPQGHQTKNLAHKIIEDSPKVLEFLGTAQVMEEMDKFKKKQRLNAFRDENMQTLEKQRNERKEKESFSNHRGLQHQRDPFIADITIDHDEEDVTEAVKNLDSFENNSDSD